MPQAPAAKHEEGSLAYTYEAVFGIFLAAIAFLGRDNASWAYPQVAYLLAALLALNLAAGAALRRWPRVPGVSTAIIMANCAVITAILDESGGRGSLLWVLYLLPVFTGSMLLKGREFLLVALGAAGFNAAFCLLSPGPFGPAAALDLALRSGVILMAAGVTWPMAERERRALDQLARQRRDLDGLLERSKIRGTQDDSTRRLAEIGLLTAGVLHDLRTPLTVILGLSEVGAREADLQAMRADFERIRNAGLVCRDIVSQVLAASDRREPELEPCDLREILLSSIALCSSVFEKKGITVRTAVPKDAIKVNADPRRLERLFLNLLSNASQALKAGNMVSIEARGISGSVEVAVADDGPGLSEKALAGLFKPFSTTKAAEGSTGLGLYICREIASSHGGTLEAANRPEGGARFTLRLPLPKKDGGGKFEKTCASA